MLDKVWVLETCEQALSRIPSCMYTRKEKWDPVEGIIIGETYDTYFSSDKEFNEFEKMEFAWRSSDWFICYKIPWYTVLLKNGDTVKWYEIKKSHWEFQEEFEHMNAIEKKKLEVLESQERYRKSLEDMEELLENGKKIQNKMTEKLIGPTFNTKK